MTEQSTPTRRLPVELRQVVVTSNLWSQLHAEHEPVDILREIGALLARHRSGDWGDIPAEDAAMNDQALINDTRLMSVYVLLGFKVWIITEADRSVTTVLLPEDY